MELLLDLLGCIAIQNEIRRETLAEVKYGLTTLEEAQLRHQKLSDFLYESLLVRYDAKCDFDRCFEEIAFRGPDPYAEDVNGEIVPATLCAYHYSVQIEDI